MGDNCGVWPDLWHFLEDQMTILQRGNYFVAATGTDAGKTFLLGEMCKKLREKNLHCGAIKPVASGFVEGDAQSDSAKILQSLGLENSLQNVESITPWRFAQPLAPSLAATFENKKIDFLEVQKFCHEKILAAQKNAADYFFIEGAGGVMTPLNNEKTFLDLALALKIPVLLLTQNYLGAISHTLCAVEALRSKAVTIEKIIVNDFANQNDAIKIADTILQIEKLSQIKTLSLVNFLREL